ncbi:MAG: hypothetical protein WD971_01790 [Pirellulales bacterium]
MTIRILGWIVFAVYLGAIGCRPAEQIEAYNVLKETAQSVVPAAVSSEVTDRMLAAVLPDGDTIWFFKLTGDRDLVAAQRETFQSFLRSQRFTASGADDVN